MLLTWVLLVAWGWAVLAVRLARFGPACGCWVCEVMVSKRRAFGGCLGAKRR